MRIITFEDKDAIALLDRLKLEKLEGQRTRWTDGEQRQLAEDIHRSFHYHVVRWLQEQGASCVRG
jgi:hypothetical protein